MPGISGQLHRPLFPQIQDILHGPEALENMMANGEEINQLPRIQHKNHRPFVRTGLASEYTMENCWIIRGDDDMEPGLVERTTPILELLNGNVQSTNIKLFRAHGACFPDNALPLNALKSLKHLRYIERSSKVRPASLDSAIVPNWPLDSIHGGHKRRKDAVDHYRDMEQNINVHIVE